VGALALYFASPWLVTIVYSDAFSPSIGPLQVLLPGVVALSIWQLLHQDIAGRGKPILNVYVNLMAVVLNILLNLLLIPKYGITGAAWATSLSYCSALLGAAFIYRRLTNNPLSTIFIPQYSDIRFYKQVYSHLFVDRGAGMKQKD
jgi:O-antigen/teichoic acid export membrane protein